MPSYQFRRDDAPAFDPKMFYTLRNANAPSDALSAGIYTDTNGALNMTTSGSYSSENWQLFFQSGRYFIRNYDYGSKWQLGITDDSRSIPKLYPRSGSISQQWTVNQVAGGWQLVNELWGEGTFFALPRDWAIPAIRSDLDGAAWNITSNPRFVASNVLEGCRVLTYNSAAQSKPLTGDMISSVEGFQSPSPSPSPSPSASSTIANSPGAVSTSSASRATPTISATAATSTPSTSTSSSSLSSGAIAGIAIGAILLFASIILALWFLVIRRRRNKKTEHGPPHEVDATPLACEKYAYVATEMPAPLSVSELAGRGTVHEMDGRSVESAGAK